MDDPWGIDDPPAVQSTPPLPPRLARLAEVQRTRIAIPDADLADWGFPRADELPEVQTLASEGWRPLHEAPLYCLLPAAWPATHRTWVPDRRPRVSCGGTTASYYGSVMPLPDDSAWEDDTAAQEAREAGLPAPPTGRLWLIRSPWPRLPVSAIYELVSAHAERRRDSEGAAVYRAARTVFGWDEDTAIAACPAHLRGLLDDWAAVGRIGEDAGAFVESRLTPGLLDQLRRSTGLDEARRSPGSTRSVPTSTTRQSHSSPGGGRPAFPVTRPPVQTASSVASHRSSAAGSTPDSICTPPTCSGVPGWTPL